MSNLPVGYFEPDDDPICPSCEELQSQVDQLMAELAAINSEKESKLQWNDKAQEWQSYPPGATLVNGKIVIVKEKFYPADKELIEQLQAEIERYSIREGKLLRDNARLREAFDLTTDKQQEEIFIKIHRIATVENINFASIQWKLFDEAWQAAQTAMQPEIDERDAKIVQLEEHIRKSQEQKPVAWPVMGHGNVAVGECRNSEDDTAGIIYLLLDKPREIGSDTSDVFPAGGAAPADKTLAAVYFSTPQSIDQTIEVLLEIRKNKFPLYASLIIPPLKGD